MVRAGGLSSPVLAQSLRSTSEDLPSEEQVKGTVRYEVARATTGPKSIKNFCSACLSMIISSADQ